MFQVTGVDPQWLAIAGIAVNTIGVIIVAFEWRTAMYDGLGRLEIEQELLLLASGQNSNRELEVSPKAKWMIDNTDLPAIASDSTKFEEFMKNVLILDTAERLSRRRTIFTVGFLFIVLGSVGQFVGAIALLP